VPLRQAAGPPLAGLVTAGVLSALVVGVSVTYSGTGLLVPLAVALIAGTALWFFASERRELTLAVFMLYLGLLDGYLKLKTNSQTTTLGRDLLLYTLAVGALLRAFVRREPIRLPPLSGWVLTWVAVVLVQLANPATGFSLHSLGAVRPHLEFVPLFFLGYWTMQSRSRLIGFLVLLLLIAAANGAVNVIQYSLSPAALATWGPGYAARINGTGDVSGRNFVDQQAHSRNRPFGRGSDFGFGGAVGVLAAPAALALLALVRRHRRATLAAALAASGVVLAVVLSEARVALIGSVVALVAYLALTITPRRVLPTFAGLAVFGLVAYFVVSGLGTGSTAGSFDRYRNIAPGQVLNTTIQYRGATLAELPNYFKQYPLGAGLGKVGPAASFASGGAAALNAESETNYLALEVGIAGLVVFVLWNLRLLWLSSTRIRRIHDSELRLLLSAIAAPLFAILVSGAAGVTSATSPMSPYLWFAGGILSYWLIARPRESAASAPLTTSGDRNGSGPAGAGSIGPWSPPPRARSAG
jgi:hypothetical protein